MEHIMQSSPDYYGWIWWFRKGIFYNIGPTVYHATNHTSPESQEIPHQCEEQTAPFFIPTIAYSTCAFMTIEQWYTDGVDIDTFHVNRGDKVAAGLPAGSHFLWHLVGFKKFITSMAPWLFIPNENESNTSNGQSIWLRRLGSFHCKLFEERREESSFRLFHQKGSPRTTQRLPSPIVWVAMACYECCFHLGIHLLEFITTCTWLFFGQSVPWFTGRCDEWLLRAASWCCDFPLLWCCGGLSVSWALGVIVELPGMGYGSWIIGWYV